MPHFGGTRQHGGGGGGRGGGLLQRLFQGARDRRRNPNVRETQNDPASRFDEQGNLRPGQPAQPTRGQEGGDANPPTPPDRGPNPLDPSTQLNEEGTQRRQDTRFQFEEKKGALEEAEKQGGGLLGGRRRDLDQKRGEFLRSAVEAGKAAGKADILTPEEQEELKEGDTLQSKLTRQGALGSEDLARAKELGLLDNLDPEEKARIERTALLDSPTLPGGSGRKLAVDRERLTQLSAIGPDGNPTNVQVGGKQAGITQILNPQNVDEFLFNASLQPPETRQKIFQAISRAGGADAIFEASGGNISETLFLFGDQGGGGDQFGNFGSDFFDSQSGGGGDLLESMGILFGGQPGFQGNNLPGTTEPVPTGLPGVPNGVGQGSAEEGFVQKNLLGALFQIGFGGQGGTVPLPTGTFG